MPIPNLSLISLSDYPKKGGKRVFTVSTSRGCNSGCTFCSQTKFWQKQVRFKDQQVVIKTIEKALKLCKIDYIRILDDNFLFNKQIAKTVARYLKSVGLPWECQARIDSLDIKVLRFLAECGIDRIFIGLETASPKIQKIFKKKIDLEHSFKMIEEANKLNIKTKVSFQIGAPDENESDIEKTVKYASALPVDEIAIFITTPFPGTEIEKIAIKKGLLDADVFLDLDPSTPSMSTGFLSKEQILNEAQNFLEKVKESQWGHHSRKGREKTIKGG